MQIGGQGPNRRTISEPPLFSEDGGKRGIWLPRTAERRLGFAKIVYLMEITPQPFHLT